MYCNTVYLEDMLKAESEVEGLRLSGRLGMTFFRLNSNLVGGQPGYLRIRERVFSAPAEFARDSTGSGFPRQDTARQLTAHP